MISRPNVRRLTAVLAVVQFFAAVQGLRATWGGIFVHASNHFPEPGELPIEAVLLLAPLLAATALVVGDRLGKTLGTILVTAATVAGLAELMGGVLVTGLLSLTVFVGHGAPSWPPTIRVLGALAFVASLVAVPVLTLLALHGKSEDAVGTQP